MGGGGGGGTGRMINDYIINLFGGGGKGRGKGLRSPHTRGPVAGTGRRDQSQGLVPCRVYTME